MKTKLISIIAFTIFAAAGCSFSTANISELKFGKNDTAKPAATSFAAGEKIYAVATVSNAMGKHKVKFDVKYENVPGKGKGEKAVNTSVDADGDAEAFFYFTSDLPGDYSIDASLVDESGKELSKKSGTIKLTGTAPAVTKPADVEDDADHKLDEK